MVFSFVFLSFSIQMLEEKDQKLEKLLEQYSFWTIGPEIKTRIDSFCSNNITNTIATIIATTTTDTPTIIIIFLLLYMIYYL